ncbi:MAG: glycosyltransferase [Cytophagaceae bacterium]|nr:glycosyltransferase [Cytophagaceae bacterium]
MSVFLLLLAGIYLVACLVLVVTWWRMPVFQPKITQPSTSLTVIVPVRNEAKNLPHLLADLNAQTYPHFEVIIADDASSDDTVALARAFSANFKLQVLSLSDEPSSSPKKRAIHQAIQRATGTLIVTTDGDCRVGSEWLCTLASFYEETGAKLISAPVTFTNRGEDGIFATLQTIEFASLIGSGAVTMALNRPSMCNGANLCYEKTVFEAVGGFAGNEHLASGDDEFLMHKVATRFPGSVQFLKNKSAIVRTEAHRSFRSFYQQRRRWASKWRHYRDARVGVLAVTVFVLNAAPLLGLFSWAMGWISGTVFLVQLLFKFALEAVFLAQVLRFLKQQKTLRFLPLMQVLYPFYSTFFGLVAQGKGYVWKGRRLQ